MVRGRALSPLVALLLFAQCYETRAWDVKAGISTGGTLSDNINLSTSGQDKTGMSLDIMPRVQVEQQSARLNFLGYYYPTLTYYTHGDRDASARNTLGANANLVAVPNMVFVDASATVRQSFLSPFGPTVFDSGVRSDNEVEQRNFSISPYLLGQLRSDLGYQLRYTNSSSSTTRTNLFDGVTNRFNASLNKSSVSRLDWGLSYVHTETDYDARSDTREDRSILTVGYRFGEDLRLFGRTGYESNNFSATDRSEVNYGGGFQWNPSSRTAFSGSWDHRYFGSAFDALLSHRFRYAFVRARASQDVRNTSDQSTLAAGVSDAELREVLDEAFKSRFPDDIGRGQVIQDLLDQGLSAFRLYELLVNQTVKVRTFEASVGLNGAKRNLVLTVSDSDTESGIEAPELVSSAGANAANNNHRRSISLSYSQRLAPRLTGMALAYRTRATTDLPGLKEKSTQDSLTFRLIQNLTARSSVTLGARISRFESLLQGSYDERALFATFAHSF